METKFKHRLFVAGVYVLAAGMAFGALSFRKHRLEQRIGRPLTWPEFLDL